MIEPNKKLLDALPKIPTITIGGKDWPVPKFAPKQNVVIVPIVLEMSQELIKAMSSRAENKLDALAQVLTADKLIKMNDVVYTALTKGHPDLSRSEYDEDLEVGTMEMIEAFITIATQTGLIKIVTAKAAAEAAKLPGEGEAVNG